MKKKISKHSRSFIAIFSVAFVGVFLVLLATRVLNNSAKQNEDNSKDYQAITYSEGQFPNNKMSEVESSKKIPPIDTTNWKDYQNEKFGLNFKYDPSWKIRSVNNKDGYYVIEIDPGAKYDNFRVYVSEDDYFALDGVPTKSTKIGGQEAIDLDGMVLGVKDNATYFTFDMGASLSLKPYFQALIDTVSFK